MPLTFASKPICFWKSTIAIRLEPPALNLAFTLSTSIRHTYSFSHHFFFFVSVLCVAASACLVLFMLWLLFRLSYTIRNVHTSISLEGVFFRSRRIFSTRSYNMHIAYENVHSRAQSFDPTLFRHDFKMTAMMYVWMICGQWTFKGSDGTCIPADEYEPLRSLTTHHPYSLRNIFSFALFLFCPVKLFIWCIQRCCHCYCCCCWAFVFDFWRKKRAYILPSVVRECVLE